MPILHLNEVELPVQNKQDRTEAENGSNKTPLKSHHVISSGPHGSPEYIPDLSIVIPVLNEEGSIIQLIREVTDTMKDYCAFEIIVVDDGSTDSTLKKLKDLLMTHKHLRLVSHRKNYGQSTAIHSGISIARADHIVTLDGDGQNDPKDIINLHKYLLANAENKDLKLICGHRKKRHDNIIKRLSSRIANKIRSKFLNDGIIDTGCGIKLIEKEAFLKLPYFDHMHRFLPALVIRNGGMVKTVEVSHRSREHGKSKYGINNRLWVGIIDMLGVFWLMRRGKIIKLEEVTKNDN